MRRVARAFIPHPLLISGRHNCRPLLRPSCARRFDRVATHASNTTTFRPVSFSTRSAMSARAAGKGNESPAVHPPHSVSEHKHEVRDTEAAMAIPPVSADFDKGQFDREVHLCALRIPVALISAFVKLVPRELQANISGHRNIIMDETAELVTPPTEEQKGVASASPTAVKTGTKKQKQRQQKRSHMLMLLNSSFKVSNAEELDLPAPVSALIKQHGVQTRAHTLRVGYSELTHEEVLRRLLPADIGVPTGFETVGHIAHLNLRDEQLPYRYLIGAVIVDKMPNIETVVTKVGAISNQFRVFNMEVIGGRKELVTVVKEHGCTFHFDFSKVYWNSRLQTEHQRTVNAFDEKDVIGDMFCGVGPFAVPAGRKGCTVYANDLNPESVKYLRKNIAANKVQRTVHPFNMDAREFMRHMATEQRAGRVPYFQHAVMNLPATAISFLDVFRGLYPHASDSKQNTSQVVLPRVHCYCFSAEDDAVQDVTARVCKALGVDHVAELTVRLVRNVAPKKDMFCASFPLPLQVATAVPAATTAAAATASALTTDADSAMNIDVDTATVRETEPPLKKKKS